MKQLCLLIAITFLALSCSKEKQISMDSNLLVKDFSTLSDVQKNAYLLNSLGFGMLSQVDDLDFKKQVYEACLVMFDDDHNVLLKDLPSFKTQNKLDEIHHFINKNYEVTERLEEVAKYDFKAVSDRANLDYATIGLPIFGHTLYSQIYIPFIENYDVNQPLTIAIGDNDRTESGCRAVGYKFVGDEIVALEIDEEYAKNNAVWVLSMNETVADDGELEIAKTEKPAFNSNRSISNLFAEITKVKVSDKKDCFYCGKAEVSAGGFFLEVDSDITCDIKAPSLLHSIAKVGNSDLNNWVNTSKQYLISSTNDELRNLDKPSAFETDAFMLVLFERDWYGHTIEVTWPTSCGTTETGTFSSNDTPYGKWGQWYTETIEAWDSSQPGFHFQTLSYGNEHLEIRSALTN